MKKILVGGVFSIIHPGHIYFLKKAKSLGDHLTVVLTHDNNVKKKNGILFVTAKERKNVIEAIKYVDSVVIGDEMNFFKPIKKVKPDVIVFGYDQKFDMVWLRNTLKKNKMTCKIERVKESFGAYSTTKIFNKIKAASAKK